MKKLVKESISIINEQQEFRSKLNQISDKVLVNEKGDPPEYGFSVYKISSSEASKVFPFIKEIDIFTNYFIILDSDLLHGGALVVIDLNESPLIYDVNGNQINLDLSKYEKY